MSYLSEVALLEMGFKSVGKNVKISSKAAFYDTEKIEIGNNSRIDDFCVISGKVILGEYCYIGPGCLVAGGREGAYFSDFSTLAYGVKIFTQSDDYSGQTLTNSTVPREYKNEKFAPVYLQRHVIVGTNSVIFPGVTIAEGCSIGAMSLVIKSTESWGVYVGIPVRRLRERKKELLLMEKKFRNSNEYK